MSELGPDSKALLDMARGGDEPTAVDRARVRGALGPRLAVGAIAAGAALTAASSSSAASTAGATAGVGAAAGVAGSGIVGSAVPLGIGMKILLVLGTATAVSVGAVSYVESGPAPSLSPPITAHATATARGVPPRAPSATPPALPQPAVSVTATPSSQPSASTAPSALPPAASATSPSLPPSSPTPAASAIDREIGLVREALAAIQAGDGGRALVLLDEHARRYPSGTLSEEREAARVFALCSLGRTGEARVAAERFLRVFPHSPQAGRVRTSCGGENP